MSIWLGLLGSDYETIYSDEGVRSVRGINYKIEAVDRSEEQAFIEWYKKYQPGDFMILYLNRK